MIRTNTFEVVPRTDRDAEILRRMLDASASLWNEVNYARRQRFFDDENIWETEKFYDRYVGVLGGASAQTVIRRNSEAWKSFFALCENPDESPSPPGYWGNEDDGRELRTYVRNDAYDIQWGDRSRLEIRIGQDLKDEYGLGYYERLSLEVRGEPHWEGDPGRLVIEYDELSETFRASQPVTVPDDRQDSPLAHQTAALDLGVNTLVACTTSGGQQYRYNGKPLFERFRETTEHIADLRAKLPDDQPTSRRIRRLYRKRTRRRDHAVKALVRDLVSRLHQQGVATVIVGDLSGGFEAKWTAEVNEMVHNFWTYRKFTNQLQAVCEEYGMEVVVHSEAGTSQSCPDCGRIETTTRHQRTLTCACGFDGHADLAASRNLLTQATENSIAGPTARPMRFKWDNHEWRPHEPASAGSTDSAQRRSARDAPENPNEQRMNPQDAATASGDGW
ncbi:RNA-guided endonuclease InsQ/TnpB family protein [Halorientalis brevis]|uniref:RNA-guided endonuclease InsQ/TnpB family protein n=1 Tax=Halorientalis brevis TaxID=1126241 RepID=A0ABD6CC34_9EURY|nr:transposase [Halorientalis brevis]